MLGEWQAAVASYRLLEFIEPDNAAVPSHLAYCMQMYNKSKQVDTDTPVPTGMV